MLNYVREPAERWNLFFGIKLSMRYHRARQAHYARWGRANAGANLIISSAAFLAVTQAMHPLVLPALMLLLTAWNAWALIVDPSRMYHLHASLHDRFSRLSERIEEPVVLTPEELGAIGSERLAIERDEPPALRDLQDICYRQTALAFGVEPAPELPLLRRLVAQYVS
jgi:hypothetical protein